MIKWFKTVLLTALVSCHSFVGMANADHIAPYKAEYTAYKWGDALGTASIELVSLENGHYSLLYSSHVSKFFLSDKRTEHSIFSVEDGKFIPKEYHYSRSGTGKDKKLSVDFDRETQRIKISKGGKTSELDWQDESDNQLYRLFIPDILKSGETNFDVNFINYRGEKKRYVMAAQGTEALSLPYGALDAIKVKIVRQNSSRETFAWFSPSLDYQLVRLQQFKDGEEQGDIRLATYSAQ